MQFATRNRSRPAFTLTELMIVIAIIAIMAGLGLSAMNGATNLAREHRTSAQITKIDQLLMERYEGYRTRAVPLKIPPPPSPGTLNSNRLNYYYNASNPQQMASRDNALLRLLALRALMRMELPDRRTDIVNFTTNPPSLEVPGLSPGTIGPINLSTWLQPSALQKSYFRTAVRALGGNPGTPSTYTVLNNWTVQNEGAECLYLIISTMRDGDKAALDYFDESEIGDTDGDGMKEILDGWGTPIEFLRWAPGYLSTPGAQIATLQVANGPDPIDATKVNYAPDPYDPAKVDPRQPASAVAVGGPYALYPLIFSAGADKKYDIVTQLVSGSNDYRSAVPPPSSSGLPNLPNDPYFNPATTSTMSSQSQVGTPKDADGDGYFGFMDNITNHSLATQK